MCVILIYDHTLIVLQDFVHHFQVLLPRGTTPTKSGIREFFRRIHLLPAGYQVGNTMVRVPVEFSFGAPCQFCNIHMTFVCDEGVPAGGGASASSGSPPPRSPAANRHAAAALQGGPGEETLCEHEKSHQRYPGTY